MRNLQWIESELPGNLEIRQVYGFIFKDDGRLLLFEDLAQYNIPGGRPENTESIEATLKRETTEEVQVSIDSVEYLGFQRVEDQEVFAQVRCVALFRQAFLSLADPSTQRTYRRLWVPLNLANQFLNWGDSGDEQLLSAKTFVSKRGFEWDRFEAGEIERF